MLRVSEYLFNAKNHKNDAGVKVRENPKTGPYVDGLSQLPVRDHPHISKLMDDGTKARTVASTQMNATSIRAHTIFTVNLTQTITSKHQSPDDESLTPYPGDFNPDHHQQRNHEGHG